MTFRQLLGPGGLLNRERRSKFLLISIVLFFVLPALSERHEAGRIILILNLYVTLVGATMELAGRKIVFWSAIPIACASMVLIAVSHYFPTPPVRIADALVLAIFLALASISLFVYLGQEGQITTGGIYISVSLYFLIGMVWFSVYNLLNIVQPGSFVQGGVTLPSNAPWSTILYFSLTTLTTLGYGDIVAVTPAARMFATIEAAAGVLYVAITIARLVASRQAVERRQDS
jgi:Ion channel